MFRGFFEPWGLHTLKRSNLQFSNYGGSELQLEFCFVFHVFPTHLIIVFVFVFAKYFSFCCVSFVLLLVSSIFHPVLLVEEHQL